MSCARASAIAIVLLAVASAASAQSTVFVVRHAERADTDAGGPGVMTEDPDLSQNGRRRAERLASILHDAGVRHIFVTPRKRTLQTAEPLARVLGIRPVEVGARDVAALVKTLDAVEGNALVVGHSNTVDEIVEALGGPRPPKIGDAEYDHLFIVVRGSTPTVVHLRY